MLSLLLLIFLISFGVSCMFGVITIIGWADGELGVAGIGFLGACLSGTIALFSLVAWVVIAVSECLGGS
jgi:hypothetical protein